MTIRCFYSCDACGLKKIACDVPARDAEDIKTWMDQTVQHISNDHRRRSPRCHPTTLTNLMIPVTGAEKLGGPSVS